MKRLLSVLKTAAIVVLITLLMDVALTAFVPSRYLDTWVRAREGDDLVYRRDVAWHHELMPNLELERGWGFARYRFATDRYGSRTGKCAATNDASEKDSTVFLIGDSFAEGMGVAFEQSFAGLLACAYRERGYALRNLGSATYSPIIYWRKIADSVKRLDIKPKEIVVFLDISDAYNDAEDYGEDGANEGDRVINRSRTVERRVKEFLKRNSTIVAVVTQLKDRYSMHAGGSIQFNNPLSLYTVDPARLEAWGKRGMELNGRNLAKIVK